MPLNLKNLSVLVVDDNKPIRELLAAVLEALGVGRVHHAANGDMGFILFLRERPDIIFLDWDMGDVSGIHLTERIRRDPLSHDPMVPIIMLTGYSAAFRVQQARDVGVTEFMVKPFTAQDVARRLTHVINKPRDFVRFDEFAGPDRRRHADENFNGPNRRKR